MDCKILIMCIRVCGKSWSHNWVMLQSVFPTFGERKFVGMVGLFFKLERGIGLLGFWGGKKGVITWVYLSSFLNPSTSLFNDYSLINDYLSLKKI